MKKYDFIEMINIMVDMRETNDGNIEFFLRNLKYKFDDDEVAAIEDYVYGLNDNLKNMSVEEFYHYIYTC